MKIMIRRWIDGTGDTMVKANNEAVGGLPVYSGWASEALRLGADTVVSIGSVSSSGTVIIFSKAEKLYTHNTLLTAKQINNILKRVSVVKLKEDDKILIHVQKPVAYKRTQKRT